MSKTDDHNKSVTIDVNHHKTKRPLNASAVVTVEQPQVPEPATANTIPSEEVNTLKAVNTPGVLILQWLTYVFWGWTCLTLILLSYLVATYLVKAPFSSSDSAPYVFAAALVLLPISIVCDLFYSHKEPTRKTGASMILMVIHAVIFAVFSIGALITLVFAVVNQTIDTSDSRSAYALMLAAGIVSVIYAVTFLRTLNPLRSRKAGLVFSLFMIIVVGALATFNAIGPMNNERLVRQDATTNDNLTKVVLEVNRYTKTNNKLPLTLNDVAFAERENPLVIQHKVRYTPLTTESFANQANVPTDNITLEDGRVVLPGTQTTEPNRLPYKICVDYKADTTTQYEREDVAVDRDSESFYPGVHKAGERCYSLYVQQTVY